MRTRAKHVDAVSAAKRQMTEHRDFFLIRDRALDVGGEWFWMRRRMRAERLDTEKERLERSSWSSGQR